VLSSLVRFEQRCAVVGRRKGEATRGLPRFRDPSEFDVVIAEQTGSSLPRVSVVIPTRDRWPLLSRTALRAARGQVDVDLEIVVVDDGSVDGTADRLDALADDRLRVLRHDRPRGVSRARNAGIASARGEWVAFLDDDDVWAPRKLRLQLEAARREDAALVYAGAVWVDYELRFLYGHTAPDPATLASALMRWNVLWGGCSNVLVRTDLVRELGGFDEDLHQLGDWDLWIRLALAGVAARADDVLVGLVAHRQSMLLVDRRDVFLEFERLSEKHRKVAARVGHGPDRALFARWVAAGHLRAGRRAMAARTYLRGNHDPGNVVRAAGAVLGSHAMRAGSRLRARLFGGDGVHGTAVEPAWLGAYR
jgi:glycosyltransferase involved in cell wall biosynthesis